MGDGALLKYFRPQGSLADGTHSGSGSGEDDTDSDCCIIEPEGTTAPVGGPDVHVDTDEVEEPTPPLPKRPKGTSVPSIAALLCRPPPHDASDPDGTEGSDLEILSQDPSGSLRPSRRRGSGAQCPVCGTAVHGGPSALTAHVEACLRAQEGGGSASKTASRKPAGIEQFLKRKA